MKNRDYKEFARGETYHIFNRGVDKMEIFREPGDYRIFLSRLEENLFPDRIDRTKFSRIQKRRKILPPKSFDLICYCLMPNHFHFIIRQLGEIPVSKLLSKICTSYSMYFNKKYERVGTLFQDQFKSVLIEDNEQLLWTSFYVHKNPLEAELIDSVEKYEWSSFPEFTSYEAERLCKTEMLLDQFKSRDDFRNHFKESLQSNEANYKMAGFQDVLIDNF